ncbi:PAS domain-containing protein [Dyadobacter sp. CY347]|uniref:PAS domain-containing protein n=1 Tax=Dyadobacter sp. CY347 TaxID=2909336 RepID=UPI001F46C0A6|nr:PAS domain-containing protein [Dyadobacter sp. CY347]MCF2488077.1 PAS domain-containing protein [Dyadobacter sp. CY347]
MYEEKNIILESIGDAFFAIDQNWTISYWNKTAEKVLGKTKAQTVGYHLWDVFSDAIGSQSNIMYQQAIDTQRAVHFEDFYLPLGKWYEVSAYPSTNVLSVYFKDITERKQTVLALEESERNYGELFNLSPLPMWVFDSETLQFLDVNEAAISVYGYSLIEFRNMTIKDIFFRQDSGSMQMVMENEKANVPGLFIHEMFTHRKKDGSLMWVETRSNMLSYHGKATKIVIATDMTERYNYIHAIEEQNAKLQEIAQIQSHVVRAPLARIMGLVPMITDADTYIDERQTLLDYLLIAANELDDAIKKISGKTKNIPDGTSIL